MTFYAESIRNGHPDLAPGPALEAQYLLRQAVPGWADHMAEWEVAGKAVLAGCQIWRNILYGDTAEQRLDIILPRFPVRNAPVQFLIHGGYWRALDKDSILFAAGPMVQAGIVTVNIDYALCPAVSLTTLTQQCRLALRWVRDNITVFGGDPNKIHCAGHSAGAHLCAMLALTPEFAAAIRSVTGVSGIYDLAPISVASMQADLRLTALEVTSLSPLRLPALRGVQWIFAVGMAETPAFIWQTHAYAAHCAAHGAAVQLIALPEANHYSAISVLGQDGTELQNAWLALTKEKYS
jgi:arylformamidase